MPIDRSTLEQQRATCLPGVRLLRAPGAFFLNVALFPRDTLGGGGAGNILPDRDFNEALTLKDLGSFVFPEADAISGTQRVELPGGCKAKLSRSTSEFEPM